MQQHRKLVSGMKVVGLSKRLADEHLAAAAWSEPASGAEVKAVQFGLIEIRKGADVPAGRFIETCDIERSLNGDAGLDCGDAGDVLDSRDEGIGRSLEDGENIGKAVGFVVLLARSFERKNEAARHDQHGKAAGHNKRDGDSLAFHSAEVAQKLAIEVGEHGG